MDREQAVADIKFIKEILSTSTRYTNLSGIANIISGLLALVGCALTHWYLQYKQINLENIKLVEDFQNSLPLAMIWLGVFFLSVVINLFFIARKADQTGQPAWSYLAKLILFALSPSLLTGCLLTIFLAYKGKMTWIPPIWMISYGLGVWSAGLFSIREARLLGAIFIATGVVTLFLFLSHVLLILAVSFGIYHLLYGMWVFYKYGG